MIQKLDHTLRDVSINIREVFQQSYRVEAKILKAGQNFPPLKRSLSAFTNASTEFYGFFEDKVLAGVIELGIEKRKTHIQSLVVHPNFFKRGIASKLLLFSFKNFDSDLYYVETGSKNQPAIALYEKHGFRITKTWMTEFGIEKVALEMT